MFVNHSAPQAKKAWIPKSSLEHFPVSNSSSNAGSDNQGIDLSLHLNQGPIKGVNTRLNFVEAVNKGKPPILSGANVEPLGTPAWPNKHSPPPNKPPPSKSPLALGRVSTCSRCFSISHRRWACSSRIRCSDCFRLGHFSDLCRFPPHFPGLSSQPSFSHQINLNAWDNFQVSHWFHRPMPMTGGAPTPMAHCLAYLFAISGFLPATPPLLLQFPSLD